LCGQNLLDQRSGQLALNHPGFDNSRFWSIAQGHQFIHLGDDTALFGERR